MSLKIKELRVLGIETSCDETALAVLSQLSSADPLAEAKIISNLVSSQTSVHRPWGGVVPNLARREHQKNLVPLLEKALFRAGAANLQRRWRISSLEKEVIRETLWREEKLKRSVKSMLRRHGKPDIDLIAVTVGPGLEPALWTGVNLASALSRIWEIPVVPVDHIEAHILANWLSDKRPPREWPMVALVVSGGHTELVLMQNEGSYQIIGQTRDDAAGECFDKTARILGLGYPGGPAISRQAERWRSIEQSKVPSEIKKISFPRPMLNTPGHDFSFSGLKTAVLYHHRQQSTDIQNNQFYIPKSSAEIENAINDVLIAKTLKAAEKHQAKTILVGGGVAANRSLRERMIKEFAKQGGRVFIPLVEMCTDNAAAIALTGLVHSKKAVLSGRIKVNANLNLDHGKKI